MITRNDIITVLLANQDKSKDEKREAIIAFLDQNVLTDEDKVKVLEDLESYNEY